MAPRDDPARDGLAALAAVLARIPALNGTRRLRVLSQGNARLVARGRLGRDRLVFKLGFTRWQEERVSRHDAALRHFTATLDETGRYRVPRPFGAWPEHRLSAAHFAEGARLDGLLATADRATRSRLLEDVGGWLRAATAPHRQDDIFGGGYWVRRFAAEAENLDDGPHRRLARGLADLLAARAVPCAGLILARAPAHGDFRKRNFLHDPATGATVALDFDEWAVLPLARELATFLVDLARREPGADARADRAALMSQAGLPEAERETSLPFFETRHLLHSLLDAAAAGCLPGPLAAQAEAHLDGA